MEQYQRDFIDQNLPKLEEFITCNTSLIAYLTSKQLLSNADKQTIEAMLTNIDKVHKLLAILKGKTGGFQILIEGLEGGKQSGAIGVLNGCPKTGASDPSGSSKSGTLPSNVNAAASTRITVTLNFGNAELDTQVLPAVQSGLIKLMKSDTTNLKIIHELNTLGYFDQDEMSPLLDSTYRTQQERMTKLFSLIANLDPEEIRDCLELLCNLPNVPPNLCKKIQDVFGSRYPGSVRSA